MTVFPTFSKAPFAWAVLLAMALGVCGLAWKTQVSNEIDYLPARGDAEWILYPSLTLFSPRTAVPVVTRFSRRFQLDDVPPEASLHVRALRTARVWLNDKLLPEAAVTADRWKAGIQLDVKGKLRRGENRLIVEVENATGPPSLWLELAMAEQQIVSDESWSASLAGAPWRAVRLADQPAETRRVVPTDLARGQRKSGSAAGNATTVARALVPFRVRELRSPDEEQFTLAALRVSWKRLTLWGVAVFSLVCVGAMVTTSSPTVSRWLRHYGLWLLLAALMAVWIVGTENNAPSLTVDMGFDAPGHHEYVAYLQQNWRLPLANEGWEMFQPPLYYVAAAALLGVAGEYTHSDAGEAWLRRFSLAYGLLQLAGSALALRLIFPQQLRRQALGLVFAACLPVHLYLFHHVTNDVAAAAFGTLALCAAIVVLRRGYLDGRAFALLGIVLGLALLTKATVVLLVVSVFLALAYHLWKDDSSSYQRRMGLFTVAVATCVVLAAIHYGRAWWHFGTPLIGNWDPRTGNSWWTDPGFRSAAAYVPHADMFLRPLYGGPSDVWSTLYSTTWGDGFCSGTDGALRRPPWNYPAMLAGYGLAVVPLAGLIVGIVALVRSAWREPTPTHLLLVSAPLLTFAAILWMTLAVPGFGQTKAPYLVPVGICFSALAGWGWDLMAATSRWRSCLVLGLVGLWGANSLYAFWVPRESVAARTTRAFALVNSDPEQARAEFQSVLRDAPHGVEARAGLGLALSQLGRYAEATQELQAAYAADPAFAEVSWCLAQIYEQMGQVEPALDSARAAWILAPDNLAIAEYAGSLLARHRRDDEAQRVLRDTLRISTDQFSVHFILSELYARRHDLDRWFEHARYATLLQPSNPIAQLGLARAAVELNRDADAMAACRMALQANSELHAAETLLAWVLATSADDTLHDPVEAIRLARSADRASGGKEPEAWDALAAALAAIGNFEKATSAADSAIVRAQAVGRMELIGPLEARRALYLQRHAFRRPAFQETPPAVNLEELRSTPR